MVKAVDSNLGGAQCACQQAVGLDVNVVDERITGLLVVRLARRAFNLHVLPQSAAAGDIQDLDSAADAEQRKTIGQRPFRQEKFGLVDLGDDVEVAVVPGERSIASRFDIGAAGRSSPSMSL